MLLRKSRLLNKISNCLLRVNITYFNPHFCISEMPTISMSKMRGISLAFFIVVSTVVVVSYFLTRNLNVLCPWSSGECALCWTYFLPPLAAPSWWGLSFVVTYLVGRAISRQVLVLPSFPPSPHRPSLVSGGFFLALGLQYQTIDVSLSSALGHYLLRPHRHRVDGGFLFHLPGLRFEMVAFVRPGSERSATNRPLLILGRALSGGFLFLASGLHCQPR